MLTSSLPYLNLILVFLVVMLFKHCITRPLRNTRVQMASKVLLLLISGCLGFSLIANDGLAAIIGVFSSAIFAVIWLALFAANKFLGEVTYLDVELGRNVRQAVASCCACLLGYLIGVRQGGVEVGLVGAVIALVSLVLISAVLTGLTVLLAGRKSKRSIMPIQGRG